MPASGLLRNLSALAIFLTAITLLATAVTPPIYGPFQPVLIGAEVNQFGNYASISPTGPFSSTIEGLDAVQWNGATEHNANPNGAAGPKQYVQWTQGGFQAYDKRTGTPLLCQINFQNVGCKNNLPTPVSWGWFWDGSPGSKVYECGHGSPSSGILLYDQLDEVAASVGAQGHGHWILATRVNHGVHIYYCVAVSVGSDITATNWNEYEFQLDGNGSGGTGGVLPFSSCSSGCISGLYTPDYLKLGTSVEVRSGTTGPFLGGLYATWDLYSPPNSGSFVAGFETCALNRNDLVNGRTSTSLSCYYYLPANNFPWGTTANSDQSVIHSLLPADFEGATSPPSTVKVEYFLATVNPYTGAITADKDCVSTSCASTQLALFRMGADSAHPLTGPVLLPVASFVPGCYNTLNVKNTFCVPEPTTGTFIDSIGDRLMHRLPYRYISATASEQLAAVQTITNTHGNCVGIASSPCTIIEWYKIFSPGVAKPTVAQGTINDPSNVSAYLFMPSVATNKSGNLQLTFEESSTTTHPSLYTVPVTFSGAGGTGTATEGKTKVIAAGKADQQDTDIFGTYFSTTVDPCDDTTFWGTGEYFTQNETILTGFTWQTRIYTTATIAPTECTF